MNFRLNVLKAAMFGIGAVWLAAGGCASQPPAVHRDAPRVIITADGGQIITAAELDELTRAFADRYVGLLYSACDTIRKGSDDPVQRQEVQTLLLDCSSNMYDIASNADAFTRLLDMVVVTKLISQVWLDDGRAERIFGDRAQPLLYAMDHARTEAQALAARVLTVEQLEVLDSLLSDWRRENPEMIQASFVRFSNFAVGRGRSAASEVLATQGFFAEVGQARQAVDEVRLLGERVFYQLKREPTLLRWQLSTAKDDLLATPEIASTLANLDRLTNQVEQWPAHVAAEREAILAALDSRLSGTDTSFASLRDAVAETRSLVATLETASKSLEHLLTTADSLFTRFDDWHRWAAANRARPFDIREYTELVKESAATTEGLNELLTVSTELLASPDWQARIDEWNRSADGRIDMMAMQSRKLMDDFFRRVYIALGTLFVLLVGYRVISYLLMRRLSTRGKAPA